MRRQKKFMLSTLIFALLCGGPVIAQNPYFQELGPYQPNCPDGIYHDPAATGFGQIATFQNAALVDEPDRESYAQYKKDHHLSDEEFHRLFGASGMIDCPKFTGSAELACDNQTLVTAAHMFVDPETGKHIAKPSDCSFVFTQVDTQGHSRKRRIPLSSSPGDYAGGVGLNDSRSEVKRKLDDQGADWAVIRLSMPAEEVTPYEVWQNNPLLQLKGTDLNIITVSAKQTDKNYPTISKGCTIKGFHYPPNFLSPRSLYSNCDTMPGASGGADVKVIHGRSVLVSIHLGDEGRDNGRREAYKYDPDNKKEDHFSGSDLLERHFQEAIAHLCSKPLKSDVIFPHEPGVSASNHDLSPAHGYADSSDWHSSVSK